MKKQDPLALIEAIRDSTPYMHVIYRFGSCWKFYKILKVVFPEAEPYYVYDHETSHVVTKINGKFYDITGEVDYGHRCLPFDEKHYPGCTKYREKWWCKLYKLVMEAEAIVMTPKLKKKFPF